MIATDRDVRSPTRTARIIAVALAVFVAAAIVATWPVILHPGRVLAGGLGDPLLCTVILGWDADRARHLLRGLWDAPYYFPYRHTLAYSEHLLGIALFTAPIEWLFGNPVLSYNVAYVGSYVLAGFATFLLVWWLWGRADAAVLAGLMSELSQYRLHSTSHLPVLMYGWMPISLWALHKYFATGQRRWMAAFAAGFTIAGLSNGYYFYFFLFLAGTIVAIELTFTRMSRVRALGDLTAAAIASFIVIAPVVLMYFRMQRDLGFVRGEGDLLNLSAQPLDYFRVTPGAWTWGGLLGIGASERSLFPGAALIVFAVVGVSVSRTRAAAMYAIAAAVAVWLSLGPYGGPLYGWMFRTVPGFNGLRVPARLAAAVIVTLATLAGAGLAWALGRLPSRARPAFIALVATIVVLEGQRGVAVSDAPFTNAKSWDVVAYNWLAAEPPGALVELDITDQARFDLNTRTVYQFAALRHHHPIVNGYSGWYSGLQEFLGNWASPLHESEQVADTLHGLRALGVRYVMLHEQTFRDPHEAARLAADIGRARDDVIEERRFGDTWAWRLADAAPVAPIVLTGLTRIEPQAFELRASHALERIPLALDANMDTRWLSGEPQSGNEWLDVRFQKPTDVAHVQLANAPRSALDYPRHLIIESIDPQGSAHALFDGSVVARLVEAIGTNPADASVDIDLASNETMTLRLRQTGHSRPWWSVHELNLWAGSGFRVPGAGFVRGSGFGVPRFGVRGSEVRGSGFRVPGFGVRGSGVQGSGSEFWFRGLVPGAAFQGEP